MVKQRQEKENTRNFLLDLESTLDELLLYIKSGSQLYEFVKETLCSVLSMNQLNEKTLDIINKIKKLKIIDEYTSDFYRDLRSFIFSDLSLLMDQYKSFFNRIMNLANKKFFQKDEWEEVSPITLFAASYFLLNLVFRRLKNNVNKYFNVGFHEHQELRIVPDSKPIWDTSKMKHIELSSDINRIKEYAQDIIKSSSIEESHIEDRLLELQISEFIKNAIRHGNNMDPHKKVHVWYDFNNDYAKLIVEDEGEGFQNMEKWNEFNKKRLQYIEQQDIMKALQYASYRTEKSVENDGGNFLFSAMEYWDSGLVYNSKKNKVYVLKYFY